MLIFPSAIPNDDTETPSCASPPEHPVDTQDSTSGTRDQSVVPSVDVATSAEGDMPEVVEAESTTAIVEPIRAQHSELSANDDDIERQAESISYTSDPTTVAGDQPIVQGVCALTSAPSDAPQIASTESMSPVVESIRVQDGELSEDVEEVERQDTIGLDHSKTSLTDTIPDSRSPLEKRNKMALEATEAEQPALAGRGHRVPKPSRRILEYVIVVYFVPWLTVRRGGGKKRSKTVVGESGDLHMEQRSHGSMVF